MADIVVLGAGLNGLATATLLARDGHAVTVLERDPAAPNGHAAALWDGWERRGVTQFHLPHFVMPRWTALMRRELPDVLDGLEALGALSTNLVAALPTALTGGWRDGDEQFATLTARRPVLEAALAAVAVRTPGVQVQRGVAVTGLLSDGHAAPLHVTGVIADDGCARRAQLVVDCTGQRSPIAMMVAAIGGRPPADERADSGFVYYGRHFRSGDGAVPQPAVTQLEHFDSVSVLTLPCDNGTWAVVITASAGDRALRALRDPAAWEAALALFPAQRHWAAGRPISAVQVMAGMQDRRRRFVVDGEPVVTGLVAVGDAWACTNPSLGRGATIGLLHALALRDTVRHVGVGVPAELAMSFDAATEATVAPWHRMTVELDRHRLAEIDGDIAGHPYETDDPVWAIAKAIDIAKLHDPDVLRARSRIAGLLATPADVLAEPGLFDKVVAGAGSAQYPGPGPRRAELLAAIAGR